MHSEAYDYVQSVSVPDGAVLEIGARNINGSVRGLFPGRPYVGIDIAPGPDVDVVADGSAYAPEAPPAVVVCAEVLEHAENAAAICAQAHRVLSPGGVFIVTAAGDGRAPHSCIDGGQLRDGEYYANVSAHQLAGWLSGFADVQIRENPAAKDIYATAIKESACASY